METSETGIQGLLLLKPSIFFDERGYFFESYNHRSFCEAIGEEVSFLQDNHSRSTKNVLRGLHFQNPPYEQGKLIRVVSGEVFDVAVDIRVGSATFGHWYGVHLSSENSYQLWIPEGFAHGFLVLSESADVVYKTTNYWNSLAEKSILWSCKALNIKWPIEGKPILSIKDATASSFKSS